jgi:hypothetical protein
MAELVHIVLMLPGAIAGTLRVYDWFQNRNKNNKKH